MHEKYTAQEFEEVKRGDTSLNHRFEFVNLVVEINTMYNVLEDQDRKPHNLNVRITRLRVFLVVVDHLNLEDGTLKDEFEGPREGQ